MREVGVYDAKTHLPQLLDDVESGESITITRHGKQIARLVPFEEPRRPVREVIEELIEFRKQHPLDGITIRELIEEGRRF